MDVEPRQPATLPLDLLLEIIARSDDVATVVRCAVGSKALLAAMLDPGFHRRRAEANGGFDPALLLAVSYYRLNDEAAVTGSGSIAVQPPGRLRRFDTDLLAGSSESPSCRDGLLVLRRHHGILVVCNTITGHVTSLPSMGQRGTSNRGMYKPALLSVHGAGRSFELLVMYKHDPWVLSAACSLRTQIFSSQEGKWCAARDIHIHNLSPGVLYLYEASSTAPAVVGCSVHWLCYTRPEHHPVFDDPGLIILALHAESAQATVIELPQELLARMPSHGRGDENPAERFILATTAATAQGERRLSLVVAEALVISMWTTPVPQVGAGSSVSWSRQVVIRRREIGRPLASVLDAYQPIRFSMFGERSGTVLFWMKNIGLVQLNLGTKALVLYRGTKHQTIDNSKALLHEINLTSVLRCMQPF